MSFIKVPCEGMEQQVMLTSELLARSAVKNNADFYDLIATLESFEQTTESSKSDYKKFCAETLKEYKRFLNEQNEPGTATSSDK